MNEETRVLGPTEPALLRLDALMELCRSLEEQVSSGTAPLRVYGLLAEVHRELEMRRGFEGMTGGGGSGVRCG